jgi:DNA-binding IclR family transcriptional regulator
MESIEGKRGWTFITNHGQVLLVIAQQPQQRVAEIADAVGITERYAYRVLGDLQRAGYVSRSRNGRSNRYRLNVHLALGDPVVGKRSLRELLRVLGNREHGDLLAAFAPLALELMF